MSAESHSHSAELPSSPCHLAHLRSMIVTSNENSGERGVLGIDSSPRAFHRSRGTCDARPAIARLRASGRMVRSTTLESISMRPSSRKRLKPFQRDRAWRNARRACPFGRRRSSGLRRAVELCHVGQHRARRPTGRGSRRSSGPRDHHGPGFAAVEC